MSRAALTILSLAVVCQLFVSSASADRQQEDELVAKYEKILDEFENEQPASFRTLFKAKRVDRLKSDYAKLNAALEKRLPNSENPEVNLQAAAELLANTDNKGLAEALEYFVALKELNEGERCNSRSETILRLNDYLSGGRARTDDEREAAKRNRVDKIVRHFAVAHEEQCRDVYAPKYAQRLAEMSGEQRERVFGLLSDEKLALMLSDSTDLLTQLMFIGSNLRLASKFKETNEQLANTMFNSLVFQATGDNAFIVNGAIDEKLFEGAYEKYLTQPCQSYVSAFGRDIFQPAILDLGTSDKVMQRTLSDDEVKYVLGLGRYAICDAILRQGEPFRRLVMKQKNQ